MTPVARLCQPGHSTSLIEHPGVAAVVRYRVSCAAAGIARPQFQHWSKPPSTVSPQAQCQRRCGRAQWQPLSSRPQPAESAELAEWAEAAEPALGRPARSEPRGRRVRPAAPHRPGRNGSKAAATSRRRGPAALRRDAHGRPACRRQARFRVGAHRPRGRSAAGRRPPEHPSGLTSSGAAATRPGARSARAESPCAHTAASGPPPAR